MLELQIAAICGAVVRNSFVFCNSVSADRSGMAAAAASAILFCFASENCKSHCSGCMKVANGALAADFFILALMICLWKFLLKSASTSPFFRFGVEIRFWSCKSLQFVEPLCVILLCFATRSLSADRSGIVASTLVERYVLCSPILQF